MLPGGNMLRGLKNKGLDWRNPHYLFPKNINAAYYDIIRKLRKKFPKPVPERIQKKFNRLKERFIGLEFKDGDLIIRTLESPKAYIEESREMHNCIERCECYLKSSSIILCATLKRKRLANIELSLETYRILQCCSPCNSYVKERELIEALIKKNIPEIIARQYKKKGEKSIEMAA